MMTPEEIEHALIEIQVRNQRVEADKAWETSWTRRGLILILTYFVVVVFFLVTKLPNPWLNAIVPVLAFSLSTSTVSLVKKRWLRKRSKIT